MLERLASLFYIFPFRLLLNHVKENFFLILSWFLILLIILGQLGDNYGVPILFLNPEYIGVVGYFSFQLVGICLGAFYITWNLVSYLLYSYRYPFMASLKWPFAMFTFNNSMIPFYFILIYIFEIVQYQTHEMGKDNFQIFWMILGLLSGFVLVLLIVSVYFHLTNKNVHEYLNPEEDHTNKNEHWDHLAGEGRADRVDFYLSRKMRFRHIRDVTHYHDNILRRVFMQHHLNAFLIILLNALVLIALGFVIDKPLFEIPAAGSIFLFCGLLISLAGLIYYWSGRWGSVMVIVIFVLLNTLSQFKFLQTDSEAYGLDYSSTQEYSLEVLDSISSPEKMEEDILSTLQILNTWKEKNMEGQPYYHKPKLCIILASGGGSRSATYSMKVIQTLDSLSEGSLMNHATLMTGASGGMLGLAYYRELYLRKQLGLLDHLNQQQFVNNIGGDLINKIMTTVVSNDLFFGFKKYTYNDKKYPFDRGTAFEIALNTYTEDIMDKPISAYKDFEKESVIPMMFISAANVSDMRKLVISPQAVSYMMRGFSEDDPTQTDMYEIDAIDFGAFFSQNSPFDLRMTSALRMNATYPLILPNVSLPSQPKMDVFDAGIRDNFGMESAARFLNVFQDWIKYNTSGVVIVEIRDNVKNNPVEDFEYKTFLSKLTSSFGSIGGNITISQDYLQDYMLQGIDDVLKGKIERVVFEYVPAENEKRVSMSLRLSEKEKSKVSDSALSEENMLKYERVIELLK
ncbi:MAG: hypothetical protein ACI9O4_000778 [Chitinophagales bacterium]|jgi:hypothetical protein